MTQPFDPRELELFGGDRIRYCGFLSPEFYFSLGVQFLLENTPAARIVSTVLEFVARGELATATRENPELATGHTWRVTTSDAGAVLTAHGPNRQTPFAKFHFGITDFPLAQLEFFMIHDGTAWHLALASESDICRHLARTYFRLHPIAEMRPRCTFPQLSARQLQAISSILDHLADEEKDYDATEKENQVTHIWRDREALRHWFESHVNHPLEG